MVKAVLIQRCTLQVQNVTSRTDKLNFTRATYFISKPSIMLYFCVLLYESLFILSDADYSAH